ncbi:MAG: AAA family ATPase [Acidobacteria bacterium]|nr:AAA family ATPase [Acidobacteriota bacterium]
MYLRKVHIENIRSIAKLDWEIPEGQEAGWHVVIGDNGSGKSTFLRAIALVLVGLEAAQALRQNWDDWLRKGESQGRIELNDHFRNGLFEPRPRKMMLIRQSPGETRLAERFRDRDIRDIYKDLTFLPKNVGRRQAYLPITAQVVPMTFSAAYGPFRRFTGGDPESEKLFHSNPLLSSHLSIFGENIALTESLKWLKDLDYRQAKKKPEGALLDRVKDFVNQPGFMPHHAKLTEISPDGIIFTDGDGHRVLVEELSDGYRSVLSMTFELIRQMSAFFKPEQVFSTDSSKIITQGIVLIDEVDAHLHPTWQRRIGLWFREHFPNIQFIVTTHSPLVCQAAEHGTVFRLPAPGSDEKAKMVQGVELNRLLYGNVLDAYGTELFGEDVGRSEAGKKLLQELAALNVKEVNQGLSKAEKKKQQVLRATFPTSSPTTNGHKKKSK